MADYISKQTVLDYLNGYLHSIGDADTGLFDSGQRRALTNAIQDIMAVKASDVQPINQWISVDDKLPATRKTVLIYDEYEGVSAGYYDSDYAKFRSIDDVYRSCNVTHWQPLPEPPAND